ncbi:MAG: hypothetical protein ABFD89_12130 [Bryobacteraceae bacterium]
MTVRRANFFAILLLSQLIMVPLSRSNPVTTYDSSRPGGGLVHVGRADLSTTGALTVNSLNATTLTAENIFATTATITVTSTDHGALSGLGDDDHTQYLLAIPVGGRTSFATNWSDLTDAGATTLHKHDHGGMDGLADDDHTQYHTDARGDARYVNVTGDNMTGALTFDAYLSIWGTSSAEQPIATFNLTDDTYPGYYDFQFNSGSSVRFDDFASIVLGADVNIYRSAADVLKTDDALIVAGASATANQVNVDNLRLDGNTVSSTNTNGAIGLVPNGSGGVGVATASPGAGILLDVAKNTSGGETAARVANLVDAANTRASLTLSTGGGWVGSMTMYNGAAGDGRLGFVVPSSGKFSFTGGTKFGLGLTGPLNQLDVEGGSVFGAGYAGTNTAPTNGALFEGYVGFGTTSASHPVDVGGNARVQGGYLYMGTDGSYATYSNGSPYTMAFLINRSASTSFNFSNGLGTRMSIDNDGGVTAEASLNVTGKGRVNEFWQYTTALYSGAGTVAIATVPAGGIVDLVLVDVITPSDGAAPDMTVGDGGNAAGYFDGILIDSTGSYGYDDSEFDTYLWSGTSKKRKKYAGADTVDAFISWGGASEGEIHFAVKIITPQ